MTENQTTDSSQKLQLSLTALMFFAPLVKYILKEDDTFDIHENDKHFVSGYINLGFINLGLAAISLCFGLLSIFFDYQWIYILFMIFSVALLIILVIGTITAFADIEIHFDNKKRPNNDPDYVLPIAKNILLQYLPIINIYIWYKEHNFESDDYFMKESQLLWAIFAIICFTNNIYIIGLSLIVIILRIVSLMVIGDILPLWRKDTIKEIFHKNIEESWGLISGGIVGCITHLFKGKTPIGEYQKRLSLPYSYLFDVGKHSSILRQYVILILGTGYFVSNIELWTRFGFVIVGIGLLWSRYLLMAIIWKHLPPIPLIDDLFRNISKLFSHPTIQK